MVCRGQPLVSGAGGRREGKGLRAYGQETGIEFQSLT